MTSAPADTAPASTDASPATMAPATTAAVVPDAATALAYSEPGEYGVGFTTLTLPSGSPVAIWYPAEVPDGSTITYDVRDSLPEALRALLTGDVPATFSVPGAVGAPPASGTFPAIVYSHGFAGINVGSSFLTAHLASWGFIVAAPEHTSRDLSAVTGGQTGSDPTAAIDDVLATVELLRGLPDADVDHLVLVGHSAGGGTVLGAATRSADVDAYVSLASGVFAPEGEQPVMPSQPSLFVGGLLDSVVANDRTTGAFDAAPAPSRLWLLGGVGHNGFDDFCTIGGGTGIVGLAEASGLGAFLDTNPQLRSLGSDGCVPPAVPVADAWPVIRHVVTAFAREQVGFDDPAVGLGPEVLGAYPIDVSITEKLG